MTRWNDPENWQLMGVDGEQLRFKNYVKFDMLPKNLDVIVDYDYMLTSLKYFEKDPLAQ